MTERTQWTDHKSVKRLAELKPDAFRKFVDFEEAAFSAGALSEKVKELMAVGITHVTQCDACIAYHTARAKEAGATDEEIAEAVLVAMSLRAGAAVGHFASAERVLRKHKD